MKENESERRQPGEWHLDKTVSLTHIFSTVSAIVALVIIASQFNTRLALVELALVNQHATNASQERVTQEFRLEMRDVLKSTNDKLDRLIESNHTPTLTRR